MHSEWDRARAQFEYEREHRLRILKSPAGPKRKQAFSDAYEGLYAGIADGTFLNQESEPEKKAEQKFRLLRRLLAPSDVAAELGPGDYALANIVAPHVKSLAIVDVVGAGARTLPKNCRVYVGDGTLMPKAVRRIDIAWSSHVVEHIHPKTLHQHLVSVRWALAPGGRYLIFTPNRFTGPHDISKMFSPVAQGLHLKEYTVTELRTALLRAKFRSVRCYAGGKGVYVRVPVFLPLALESILSILPFSLARFCARCLPLKALLGIILVGTK